MKRSCDGRDKQDHPPSTGAHTQEHRGTPIISSLEAPVSPPRRRSTTNNKKCPNTNSSSSSSPGKRAKLVSPPNLAAIEAGQVEVTDHLSTFSTQLSQFSRPVLPQVPRLQIKDWVALYQRNQHAEGRHFVIHQHDHPIAGPHYDLRLQFSSTSSVSWSVMYGLPGDPNSRRLNRNATETRVHCLWNHLIETASAKTGSMVIWDTGEYEILPYQSEPEGLETDDSRSEVSDISLPQEEKSDGEKLIQEFQNRKIRLRLHGTRLPQNYTIILRMDKSIDFRKPSSIIPRKRRRRGLSPTREETSSSDENSTPTTSAQSNNDETNAATATPDTDIDHQIRINNAYPGSTNTIGSIHQRRWFITLDRTNSGFTPEVSGTTPGRKSWVRKQDPQTGRLMGFEPFYVRGPEGERSVVTGRLGKEVLEDEGVEGFVARRGWRAVLE